MNEFLLIFRRDTVPTEAQPSPDEMQAVIKPWQDWMGGIAAQNKLVSAPQRWDAGGRVVKQNNMVTNGPYAEVKESIGGLIIIKAESYDEAVAIAEGCPILLWGGNVEIRMAVSVDGSK
jgi:hypothetical protein